MGRNIFSNSNHHCFSTTARQSKTEVENLLLINCWKELRIKLFPRDWRVVIFQWKCKKCRLDVCDFFQLYYNSETVQSVPGGEYNAIVATFSGCCLAVVDVTENISEQKLFRLSYPLCLTVGGGRGGTGVGLTKLDPSLFSTRSQVSREYYSLVNNSFLFFLMLKKTTLK